MKINKFITKRDGQSINLGLDFRMVWRFMPIISRGCYRPRWITPFSIFIIIQIIDHAKTSFVCSWAFKKIFLQLQQSSIEFHFCCSCHVLEQDFSTFFFAKPVKYSASVVPRLLSCRAFTWFIHYELLELFSLDVANVFQIWLTLAGWVNWGKSLQHFEWKITLFVSIRRRFPNEIAQKY